MGEAARPCVLTGATLPIGSKVVFFALLPSHDGRYTPGSLHFSTGEGSLFSPALLPLFGRLSGTGYLEEVEETPGSLFLAERNGRTLATLGHEIPYGHMPPRLLQVSRKIARWERHKYRADSKPWTHLWGCFTSREVWDHFATTSYPEVGKPHTGCLDEEFNVDLLRVLGFRPTSKWDGGDKGYSHPKLPRVTLTSLGAVLLDDPPDGVTAEELPLKQRGFGQVYRREVRTLRDLDRALLAHGVEIPKGLLQRARELHPYRPFVEVLRREYNQVLHFRKHDRARYFDGSDWTLVGTDLVEEEVTLLSDWHRYKLHQRFSSVGLPQQDPPKTPTQKLTPRRIRAVYRHPCRSFTVAFDADLSEEGEVSNVAVADVGELWEPSTAERQVNLHVPFPPGFVESTGIPYEQEPITHVNGFRNFSKEMVAFYGRRLFREFAEETEKLLLFQENLRSANGHFHPRANGCQEGHPRVALQVARLLRNSALAQLRRRSW